MAISSALETLDRTKIIPTPADPLIGIRMLGELAEELAQGKAIRGVVGGVAGGLNRQRSRLLFGENISQWVGVPLRQRLAARLKAPVCLENDAALAGLGEAVYGAARGKKIVAYLTVSTGVGGCRIVDGKIDANALGFEPGYQIIDASHGLQPEFRSRRLGGYLSGSALLAHWGKRPEEITDSRLQDTLAEWLSVGLANTIVFWSPDIVVMGGSVMKIIPFDRLRYHLVANLKPYVEPPPLVRAKLNDTNGLWGALALARQM